MARRSRVVSVEEVEAIMESRLEEGVSRKTIADELLGSDFVVPVMTDDGVVDFALNPSVVEDYIKGIEDDQKREIRKSGFRVIAYGMLLVVGAVVFGLTGGLLIHFFEIPEPFQWGFAFTVFGFLLTAVINFIWGPLIIIFGIGGIRSLTLRFKRLVVRVANKLNDSEDLPQNTERGWYLLATVAATSIAAIIGCSAPEPLPTYTPYPTQVPVPTSTPQPTYTLFPTWDS